MVIEELTSGVAMLFYFYFTLVMIGIFGASVHTENLTYIVVSSLVLLWFLNRTVSNMKKSSYCAIIDSCEKMSNSDLSDEKVSNYWTCWIRVMSVGNEMIYIIDTVIKVGIYYAIMNVTGGLIYGLYKAFAMIRIFISVYSQVDRLIGVYKVYGGGSAEELGIEELDSGVLDNPYKDAWDMESKDRKDSEENSDISEENSDIIDIDPDDIVYADGNEYTFLIYPFRLGITVLMIAAVFYLRGYLVG